MGSVEGRGHFAWGALSCCHHGDSEGWLCPGAACPEHDGEDEEGDLWRIGYSTLSFLVVLFFNLLLFRNRKHSFSSPGGSFTGINQCKFTLVNDPDLQEL